MIMIIAIIYIFYLMWYLINSWKLLSENLQAPLEKIHSPPFYHPLPKNSRSASPSPLYLTTLKIFKPLPPAERGKDNMQLLHLNCMPASLKQLQSNTRRMICAVWEFWNLRNTVFCDSDTLQYLQSFPKTITMKYS